MRPFVLRHPNMNQLQRISNAHTRRSPPWIVQSSRPRIRPRLALIESFLVYSMAEREAKGGISGRNAKHSVTLSSEHRRVMQSKRNPSLSLARKSVEEAGQTAEKTHRRVTTHLNRTDTVNEEEETSSDSYEIDKHEHKLLPQRHLLRQPEPARKAIVPANPILSRRIPSFLTIYSQESSSTGISHEWHFFNLLELQSYDAMMRKLYKDENLARVKLYETYRALLTSVLASKASSKRENDDEDDYITTTAL
jgi:hypothetical protein